MSFYRERITQILAELHAAELDPRHVEAYMRLEHPTLDGLSAPIFAREVAFSARCVVMDGPNNAERCAQSFGL